MTMGRAVNIKQTVDQAKNDGIPLNIIYMEDGKPNYFDTYAEEFLNHLLTRE